MNTSPRPSTHRYIDSTKNDECALCGRRRNTHLELSTAAPAQPDNAAENQAGTNGKGKRTRSRTAAA